MWYSSQLQFGPEMIFRGGWKQRVMPGEQSSSQLPDSAGNLPPNGTREQTQLQCHKCHVGGDIPSLLGTCGHSQPRGREAVPVPELWGAGS